MKSIIKGLITNKELRCRLVFLIFFSGLASFSQESTNSYEIVNVSTIAGSDTGYKDGKGISAKFNNPVGIAKDSQGNLFVVDKGNNSIRKISPTGQVSTFAGSVVGFEDGQGKNAKFNSPNGIAIDSLDNLYLADLQNHKIRKITPDGEVSTIAGSGYGYNDGKANKAKFAWPQDVAIDSKGNIYVTDEGNDVIRKITIDCIVSTFAGGEKGYKDGQGASAQFHNPMGIAIDSQDNLFVGDYMNNRIRKITPNALVSTLVGNERGFADGIGMNAQLNRPTGIAIDSLDILYITDSQNHKIRKITPNGEVSSVAGTSEGALDGTADKAQFSWPYDLVIDDDGNIYVSDFANHRIRKITKE